MNAPESNAGPQAKRKAILAALIGLVVVVVVTAVILAAMSVTSAPGFPTGDSPFRDALAAVPDGAIMAVVVPKPGGIHDELELSRYATGREVLREFFRAFRVDARTIQEAEASGLDLAKPLGFVMSPRDREGIFIGVSDHKQVFPRIMERWSSGDKRWQQSNVRGEPMAVKYYPPPEGDERSGRSDVDETTIDRLIAVRNGVVYMLRWGDRFTSAGLRAWFENRAPGRFGESREFLDAAPYLLGDVVFFMNVSEWKRIIRQNLAVPSDGWRRRYLEEILTALAPFTSFGASAGVSGDNLVAHGFVGLEPATCVERLLSKPADPPEILHRIPGRAIACAWVRMNTEVTTQQLLSDFGAPGDEAWRELGRARKELLGEVGVDIVSDVFDNIGGEAGVVLYGFPWSGVAFVKVKDEARAESALRALARAAPRQARETGPVVEGGRPVIEIFIEGVNVVVGTSDGYVIAASSRSELKDVIEGSRGSFLEELREPEARKALTSPGVMAGYVRNPDFLNQLMVVVPRYDRDEVMLFKDVVSDVTEAYCRMGPVDKGMAALARVLSERPLAKAILEKADRAFRR